MPAPRCAAQHTVIIMTVACRLARRDFAARETEALESDLQGLLHRPYSHYHLPHECYCHEGPWRVHRPAVRLEEKSSHESSSHESASPGCMCVCAAELCVYAVIKLCVCVVIKL